MKITKIAVAITMALLLTACSNTKALEVAQAAVDSYNAAAEAYNQKVEEYNTAANAVNEKNAELQGFLDKAQEEINKGEPAFDENTLTELKTAMSDASASKNADVDIMEAVDILTVNQEAKSKELNELAEQAAAAEEELKSQTVPATPEIPDYTEVTSALQDKTKAYTDSVQGMRQVTAPTDEFVMERLQRIETITEMAPVTEDHDPNGKLGKQGGYIGCVYFEDTQVDRSRLYIPDGEDNVIDVGTDGGGAVEIFKTADEAKQREAYLATFDGGMFASGSHYVAGTCLIRTSDELTGTQQLDLTEKIINALIAVGDAPAAQEESETASTAETAEIASTTEAAEIASTTEVAEIAATAENAEEATTEEAASDDANAEEDEETEEPAEPEEAEEPKSNAVYYSTNDEETVKNGDEGVYAYIGKGPQYDRYYIIDLDEGYVYYFTDGNGEESCEKVAIDSGTLNDVVIITYHDGGDEWSYGLHFKTKNMPQVLIMQDNDGFEYEFTPTNLEEALEKRDSKEIREY